MGFTEQDIINLRVSLQEAIVKCSERCLYQSAKWQVPCVRLPLYWNYFFANE